MNKILIGMVAASALFFATTANATLYLSVEEVGLVGSQTTASDGDSGYVNLSNINVGHFSVNAGTGINFASALPNIFDLAATVKRNDFEDGTAATARIMLTEIGLTGFDAAGLVSLATVLGGSAAVSFDLYVGDATDLATAFDDVLAANHIVSAGAGSVNTGLVDFSSLIFSQPFSLTLVATFTASNLDDFLSSDTVVVPEPSILALLGTGLLGLGLARRRMKK